MRRYAWTADNYRRLQMKFQYHFDVHFIRIAAKTDLFDDFRLILAVDPTKQTPTLKNKYYHNLKLPRDQKVINLKQLEPFRFSIDEADKLLQCYNLQLRDSSSLAAIEKIPLMTHQMIKSFESIGKTVHDQRHEGSYMNLNFKVILNKEEVEKENLYASIETSPRLSPTPSKEEGGELKQTLSRAKRPPELNIKKRSELKESQKLKESQRMKELEEMGIKETEIVKPLFRGLADNASPRQEITVNVIGEKDKDKDSNKGWQPLSAVPEALSAWLRKRVKHPDQIQEVKELLESHHPVIEEQPTKTKLSIKLKIVIALLIFGVFVLIVDMLKKETYRLVYGKYPKQPKPAGKPKSRKAGRKEPKAEKREGKTREGKRGADEGGGARRVGRAKGE